jgi:hypothetical protein
MFMELLQQLRVILGQFRILASLFLIYFWTSPARLWAGGASPFWSDRRMSWSQPEMNWYRASIGPSSARLPFGHQPPRREDKFPVGGELGGLWQAIPPPWKNFL